jgi:hypothetical protein
MGGGKGGGGSVSFPPELIDIAKQLASQSEQLFRVALPGIQQGGQVIQDVLRTGGSQALTPAISKAVEQTRAATSAAQRALDENLTRAGITGTERARLLGEQALQGEVAAAQIGPNFALPLIQQAAGLSLGQSPTALSGLGGSGSLLSTLVTRSAGGKK